LTDDTKQNTESRAALLVPRRRIAVLQLITAVVAVLAMVASVVLYFQAVNTAEHRTCEVLKAIIIEATPRNRLPAARALIKHSPELHNC
jgi:hypothetical protein